MESEIIAHLFKTEYQKIVAVLYKIFGLENIAIAEDIVSDVFLLASETWGMKGLPPNPTAWLYTVSKNRTKDYLKRNNLFQQKIQPQLIQSSDLHHEMEIDLSEANIKDSQLQMMFAICHPSISIESQICLSLRFLCGFGIEEIATAFLSNKETINKRLLRAKEKLRDHKVKIEFPHPEEMMRRLETVAATLYLLFNEGYYAAVKDAKLRKDVCLEAMRLALLLSENEQTNKPFIDALLSLMCFHASRFDARTDENGAAILYQNQDSGLWNEELIDRGKAFLNKASVGNELSKYHVEAAIAYWHTQQNDTSEKWENILQLYNLLLQLEYSPVAALNRTYALFKVKGKQVAIAEAEKLNLSNLHLYYTLLGELYSGLDNTKALQHFTTALKMIKSSSDRKVIEDKISNL